MIISNIKNLILRKHCVMSFLAYEKDSAAALDETVQCCFVLNAYGIYACQYAHADNVKMQICSRNVVYHCQNAKIKFLNE